VDDDLFIIQFLPIYLVDTARAWLDHLPRNSIDCWEDLKEFFTGNFQDTYVWPGNPWDLKDCRQKQGESLRDYIWQFSQKCHEFPKICDDNIISMFWSNTNCRTLEHELSHDQPKTTKELLNITIRHASSEEAVEAIFAQENRKAAPNGSRGVPLKAVSKGGKRSAKGNKRGPKRRPQRVMVTTSCDEGGNDKEVDDSHEELIAAAERDFKH
jgi:hypothetical protein